MVGHPLGHRLCLPPLAPEAHQCRPGPQGHRPLRYRATRPPSGLPPRFPHPPFVAPPPAIFLATHYPEIGADGAVMLTASPLPWNRNGLKFFPRAGGFDKTDIRELLERAATGGEVPPTAPANAQPVDLMSRYTSGLVQIIRQRAG